MSKPNRKMFAVNGGSYSPILSVGCEDAATYVSSSTPKVVIRISDGASFYDSDPAVLREIAESILACAQWLEDQNK